MIRLPRPFTVVTALAAIVALAFLVLPVVALFVESSPAQMWDDLGDPRVTDALAVTARTNGIAFGLTILVGTPAAYLIGRRRFPGRDLVITLIELPLVLPPAVAGLGLLAAFGRLGLLGGELEALGVSVSFTQTAVVLAILFVAGPFYLRQAIASFEGLDDDLLLAERARGIGEFGATIMFAGSLQGVTQTVTLAIYDALAVDIDAALALGGLLVVLSVVMLLALKLILHWRLSDSTSAFRFATSSSG